MSKGRGIVIGLVVMSFLFSISLISAGFGYNVVDTVEVKAGDNNINIYLNGTLETNESSRFINLVQTNCPGTDKVIGVYSNGTVECGADSGSSGIDNNTRGWILNFSKIFSLDWTNITITESQITDLSHTTDTNESTRVHNIVNTTCSGQVVVGWYENGTAICEADDTGTGGKSTNGFYVYNDSANIYFNETQLNDTIDARDTDTDTDTNASTVCGTNHVLLGNSSCMIITDITPDTIVNNNGITLVEANITDLSHTVIWDATFNTSFDQRDSDTIYSAGSNLSLVGTTFSVNMTEVKQFFDTLYQSIGSYIGNNTGGWTLNFTKIFSDDWSNVTITESQITDLSHTVISSNIAYENETNTFTTDQNFSQNISIKTNNKMCIDTACTSYLWNNGTDTILQG